MTQNFRALLAKNGYLSTNDETDAELGTVIDGTTERIDASTTASNMTTITYAIKCICETGPKFVGMRPFCEKFLFSLPTRA